MNHYDNLNVLCLHVITYILHLFGSVLFTNLIDKYVPLIYLTLLDDFDIITIYSWGSIVLACLYIHLCLTCMKRIKNIFIE
jgi:hypothetical protein